MERTKVHHAVAGHQRPAGKLLIKEPDILPLPQRVKHLRFRHADNAHEIAHGWCWL